MRPFTNGVSVAVRKRRFYLPGDVLVVRRAEHWNAHRFLGYALGRQGLLAITQADDSVGADPAALASAIVGRAQCDVSAAERASALLGYLRALLRRADEVAS